MIGDLLRKTREEKNLSLADIEKETNIRKLYIKAIEDGDYAKLPGEVFLKGFIKTYAKFLGLDGQELVNQYKAEKNGTAPIPSAAANSDTAADESTAAESKAQSAEPAAEAEKKAENVSSSDHAASNKVNILNTNSEEYLKPQNSGSKKNIIIVIVIIAAIIAAAAVYLSSQSSDAPKPSAPAASSEPAAQSQPQQTQQPQQPAPVSGVELKASFSQDCWIEVKVDGNIVLSETVKAGSNLNWKGNQQIDVTVGNAGAADFTFNGQSAGKLGADGAVASKTFTAANPAAAQQPQAQPQK